MNFPFDETIILENHRTRLEPLSDFHFDQLLDIATEYPLLLQYSPTPLHSPALFQQYISNALNDKSARNRYAFAVFDKLENRYVGSTSLGNISNADLRLEIGWTWLGKAFQGNGINLHNKVLLLEFAFEKLAFERVEFRADERNLRSRKAIENLGATFEGTLRSHIVLTDGFRRNTCYYSILKHEWPEISSKLKEKLK